MKKTIFDILGVILIRGASIFLAYPLAILLSRALGSEAYGKYGVIVASYTLFSTCIVFGYDQLIVKKISPVFAKITFLKFLRNFKSFYVLAWFFSITTLFILIESCFKNSNNDIITLSVICGLIISFRKIQSSFLRSGKRPIPTQVAENIIQPTAILFFTLTLIFLHEITLGKVLACTIAGLSISVVFQSIINHKIDLKKKTQDAQPTSLLNIKSAVPFFGIAITGEIYGFADRFIITNILGYSETGVFMVAVRNASLLLIIVAAFQLVLNPHFSHAHEDQDNKKMKMIAAYQTVSQFFIGAVATIVLVALAYHITFIFGPEFVGAKWPLIIISILYFISFVFGSGLQYMYMSNSTKQAFYISVVSLVVYGICLVVLTPTLELVGAAIATGFTEIFRRALSFCYIKRFLKIRVDLFGALIYIFRTENHLKHLVSMVWKKKC